MVFGKKTDIPPDIGQEEEVSEEPSQDKAAQPEVEVPELESKSASAPVKVDAANEHFALELENLKGKFEVLSSSIKGYGERLALLSEQIGELRNMSLETEKKLIQSSKDASIAVETVKQVEPDKLRIEYQKQDTKVNALQERLESYKQYSDSILDEVKNLRRSSEVFIGTDNLVKMNDEIKQDLISLRKLSSKVELHADKSEQMFMEFRKGMAEKIKIEGIVNNLEAMQSQIKKNIEQLKVEHASIVKDTDFSNLKKNVDHRFAKLETELTHNKEFSANFEEQKKMIELALSISKRNQDEIAGMAFRLGDDSVSRVSDYENWLASILQITDTLATQMAELRRHVNLPVSASTGSAGSSQEKKSPSPNLSDLKEMEKKAEAIFKQQKAVSPSQPAITRQPDILPASNSQASINVQKPSSQPKLSPPSQPKPSAKPLPSAGRAMPSQPGRNSPHQSSAQSQISNNTDNGPVLQVPLGYYQKISMPNSGQQSSSTTLKDIDPQHGFVTHTGKRLSNIYELLAYLIDLDEPIFKLFVNNEKNDFSNWIRYIVHDIDLADKIQSSQSKDEISKAIMARIEQLQKMQMSLEV